jgi:hypothetical protein
MDVPRFCESEKHNVVLFLACKSLIILRRYEKCLLKMLCFVVFCCVFTSIVQLAVYYKTVRRWHHINVRLGCKFVSEFRADRHLNSIYDSPKDVNSDSPLPIAIHS